MLEGFFFLYFKINKLNNELINYCEILSTNTALPVLFPRTCALHASLWARKATSIVFSPLRAASSVPLRTSQAPLTNSNNAQVSPFLPLHIDLRAILIR